MVFQSYRRLRLSSYVFTLASFAPAQSIDQSWRFKSGSANPYVEYGENSSFHHARGRWPCRARRHACTVQGTRAREGSARDHPAARGNCCGRPTSAQARGNAGEERQPGMHLSARSASSGCVAAAVRQQRRCRPAAALTWRREHGSKAVAGRGSELLDSRCWRGGGAGEARAWVLLGAPGSGKGTYGKELVRTPAPPQEMPLPGAASPPLSCPRRRC